MVKCPNCGAKPPEGAAECPACGLIFAKLKELKPAAPPPAPKLWPARVCALGFLALWLLGFGLYYRGLVKRALRRSDHRPPITRPPSARPAP